MKIKNVLSFIICLTMIQFCYIGGVKAQQWAPQSNSNTDDIHRTGNVGLGTTTPNALLHISSTEGEVKNPELEPGELHEAGNGNNGQGNSNFDIRIDREFTNGSSHWAIDGGTDFNFLKEINGGFTRKLSINSIGMRIFGTRLAIGAGDEQLNIGYGPTGHFMALGYKPGSATHFISSGTTGGAVVFSDGLGQLSFATKDGGILSINDDTKMTINADGNIGIGTNAPVAKLHLMNSNNVSLRLDTGRPWDITAEGSTEELMISYGGGTPLMRVKGNGRVAIGTNETPSSLDNDATDISAYRLYVEGGILTKEVRVREVWADYVFEKDYNLLPLAAIEAYIEENGHLPNTPSAKEVAAQGINLGAATANQQEKIEELYLHLIEMDKRLEILEAENTALRKAQQD